MITTAGKTHIKRHLANMVPAIATSIAFGVGNTAAALTDTRLAFEVDRAEIKVTSFDFVSNKLVFKTNLPENYGGLISETSLIYGTPPPNSKMLSTFDSVTEAWTGGSFANTNTRIGIDSLRLTAAASASATATQGNLVFDLSANSGNDVFKLAFFNTNSNTQSVVLRLKTDASNFYAFTISTPTVGLNIVELTKSSAVVTGTPSWANITFIEMVANAKSTGSLSVDFEALKIEDRTNVTNETLVSRTVIGTPFVKQNGKVQEIEYTLDISI